ncbi:MAG: isoprenoid biosynthesis glyoxalase ElbB [Desulfobacteraceae bacterium]|nr:isoprenoid biosynthesis glyoxalase ElbB [Desulfobacteraceae bacterium]MBC2756896.1 isoprenoid biosynthesis glyoxalase ElbB [Desulfobacteraceae bacterium]
MKKIGVLLSGCGVYDGVEIHEAVITLLALDRNGAEAVCMAPDIEQHHVVNHLNGEPSDEKRNVLVESARIARGNITDVKAVNAADIDGLIIPGGFGAAKNLSNFALKGKDADINPDVAKIVRDMVDAQKPVGAICISPAVLSKILEDKSPEVTIGNDFGTIETIESIGGIHVACTVDQIHIDRDNKLITTPAYMLGPGIKDVASGIEQLVEEVLRQA